MSDRHSGQTFRVLTFDHFGDSPVLSTGRAEIPYTFSQLTEQSSILIDKPSIRREFGNRRSLA
jgi:hypothetical protein